MAMKTVSPNHSAGRLEALQRENDQLREQLRRLALQQNVARDALHDAVQEKETAARLAHTFAAEERATRAAVEVTGNNLGLSLILQILNFFVLLVLAIGLFVWLPNEVERRIDRPAVVTGTGGAIVTP